jgi:hypothetical protein
MKIEATEKSVMPTGNSNIKLTVEDKADIRAVRKAKQEYLRTGESYTVDELRAEFNLISNGNKNQELK